MIRGRKRVFILALLLAGAGILLGGAPLSQALSMLGFPDAPPNDPSYAPCEQPGATCSFFGEQWNYFSFEPKSAPGAGVSGVSADLAWKVTPGRRDVLIAVLDSGIKWDTGLQILLLLFASVTLGGLGTAFGALVGALIIGLVVELAGPLGAPGDLKYAVALAILILILLFRPQGLLGRAERVG